MWKLMILHPPHTKCYEVEPGAVLHIMEIMPYIDPPVPKNPNWPDKITVRGNKLSDYGAFHAPCEFRKRASIIGPDGTKWSPEWFDETSCIRCPHFDHTRVGRYRRYNYQQGK